nr:MAG TPA: hypothetical protein [Caudoviricetes sp.]
MFANVLCFLLSFLLNEQRQKLLANCETKQTN